MLTKAYTEALLADEERADRVWEAWNKGEIDDRTAWFLSKLSTFYPKQSKNFLLNLHG